MIICVPSGDPKLDYETRYDARNLTRKRYSSSDRFKFGYAAYESKRGQLVGKTQEASLENLKTDEKLYVVGHRIDINGKTTISGKSPDELLDFLIEKGLCYRRRNLMITLVGCRVGGEMPFAEPSFAWLFYWAIVKRFHELEIHHMEKEGSLPRIKAPKCLITFDWLDGKANVLPQNKLAEYRRKQVECDENELDQWRRNNLAPAQKKHFQYI